MSAMLLLLLSLTLSQSSPPVGSGVAESDWSTLEKGDAISRRSQEKGTISSFSAVRFDAPVEEVLSLLDEQCKPISRSPYLRSIKALEREAAAKLLAQTSVTQEEVARASEAASCVIKVGEPPVHLYMDADLPFPLSDRWSLVQIGVSREQGVVRMEMKSVAGSFGAMKTRTSLFPLGGGKTLFVQESSFKMDMYVPPFLLDRKPTEDEQRISAIKTALSKASTR